MARRPPAREPSSRPSAAASQLVGCSLEVGQLGESRSADPSPESARGGWFVGRAEGLHLRRRPAVSLRCAPAAWRPCQMNTTVGDLEGNVERILARPRRRRGLGCDLVAFPELAITGYPPEDLLLKPGFVAANREALEKLAGPSPVRWRSSASPRPTATSTTPPPCAPTARSGVYRKHPLPNYAVFDEQRYFMPGTGVAAGVRRAGAGWASRSARTRSPDGPIVTQAAGGPSSS